jgi:hypothetical protein
MTKEESPIVFLRVSELEFELKMAREEEREACAKLCDKYAKNSSHPMNFAENCAEAIRARRKP